MIEIDDAGSGSLIGGTGIGLMRTETKEYIFRIIPLRLFQDPHFREKKYQHYVIKIVRSAFSKLGVSKAEPIRVCRGYIFDELRKWLTEQEYNWESTKIEGLLQHEVEKSFSKYVICLGLPQNFVQHAKYAFGFHRLLKWVFADFHNRAPLCKSGWKSWSKWSAVEQTIYFGTAKKAVYCLKCGHLIKAGQEIITLAYSTNRDWALDLHSCCYTESQAMSNE